MSIFKLKPSQLEIFLSYHPQINSFKRQAKELHKELLGQVSLMQCQEILAKKNDYNNWHHFLKEKKNQFNIGLKDVNFIVRKDKIEDMDGEYINKDFFDEMLMGRDITYNHYKYLNTEGFRTHTLIMGDIHKKYDLFLAKQAIEKNHPISFINGDGDEDTIKELIECAKTNEREGDIKIFNTTHDSVYPEYEVGMNSKITGSSGGLAELIISCFVPDSEKLESEKDTMHAIIGFISSISMAVSYERDMNIKELTWQSLMESLKLDNYISHYNNPLLPINIRQAIRLNLSLLNLIEKSTNKVLDITNEAQEQFDLLITPIAKKIERMIKFVNMNIDENEPFSSFDSKSTDIIIIQMKKIDNLDDTAAVELHHTISKVLLSQFKMWVAGKLGQVVSSNIHEKTAKEYSEYTKRHRKAFLFIREAKCPKGFWTFPSQARATGIRLVFSYDNENAISQSMMANPLEFEYMAANCLCKIISSKAQGQNKEELIKILKAIDCPLYPNKSDYIEEAVEAQYKKDAHIDSLNKEGKPEKESEKAWLFYKNSAAIIDF